MPVKYSTIMPIVVFDVFIFTYAWLILFLTIPSILYTCQNPLSCPLPMFISLPNLLVHFIHAHVKPQCMATSISYPFSSYPWMPSLTTPSSSIHLSSKPIFFPPFPYPPCRHLLMPMHIPFQSSRVPHHILSLYTTLHVPHHLLSLHHTTCSSPHSLSTLHYMSLTTFSLSTPHHIPVFVHDHHPSPHYARITPNPLPSPPLKSHSRHA